MSPTPIIANLRLLLFTLLAVSPAAAVAAPYNSDTAGNWNTNTNWNPDFGTVGQGPRVGAAGGDSATLLHAMTYGGGGTGGASGDFTISNGNSVTIGNSTMVGSFNQTGASGSWIRIGDAGTGTLNIVNGTFIANQAPNLSVGSNGATGIINVGDGVGAAGQAILDLQTNNREMNLGQNISTVGIGQVTVNSDGIIQGGNATIRIGQGANATASTMQVNSGGTFNVRATLEVGANTGANGQLTSAGTISQSAGTFTIGWDGTGAVTFTGGTYNHTGGGETVDGQGGTTIIVGRNNGAGTLNVQGSAVVSTTGRLVTGANEGNDSDPSEGTIGLSGSAQLNVARAHLGFKGDNTVNRSTVTMSGSSQFNSNEWIAVGEFTRSQVTLNNSASIKYAVGGSSTMAIGAGNGGIGVMTLNDSSSLSGTGDFSVGNNSGSNGSLTVNGSAAVTITGAAFVVRASGSTGLLTMHGGTFSATTLNVANDVGSTGTLDLNGGTLAIGSGGIGGAGTSTINLGGATIKANASWSSSGIFTIDGANSKFDTNGNTITLSGSVNNSGGPNTFEKIGAGTLQLTGTTDNAGGRVKVSAGTVELGKTSSTSVHAVGADGNTDFALDIAGGTAKLTGTGGDQIFVNSAVRISSGTLDLNGRSEGFDGLVGTGGTITNTSAAAATLTLGQNNSLGKPAFGGVMQDGVGQLSLVKTGSGRQTLSGSNTYSGTTTISGGILAVDGTHTGAGSYDVQSGTTLGGDGTITLGVGQQVTVAGNPGVISPGNTTDPTYAGADPTYSQGTDMRTVGTLTLNASSPVAQALDMDGILRIDILNPLTHDLLKIATGTVNINDNPTTGAILEINGEQDLSNIDYWDLGFVVGTRVDILMAGAIAGNFRNFPVNQEIVDAAGNNVFFGNDGTSLYILATPEPGTVIAWLLVGVVGAACGWRLKGRKLS